jgi:hypothetical protein
LGVELTTLPCKTIVEKPPRNSAIFKGRRLRWRPRPMLGCGAEEEKKEKKEKKKKKKKKKRKLMAKIFTGVTQGLGIFLCTISSRPALGPIQPSIQWAPRALFLEIKRPGHEADHSPQSSAEVKKACIYTPTTPIRLHGVVLC